MCEEIPYEQFHRLQLYNKTQTKLKEIVLDLIEGKRNKNWTIINVANVFFSPTNWIF